MKEFEISTNILDEDRDDFLAERSLDLRLPDDVHPEEVLRLLFVGFADRLKEAGIKVEIGNFAT